jgi:hypothetical protein
VLREAEARDQPYLTKLRLTKHGTARIKTLFHANHWEEAGHGWDGVEDTLMLSGWSRTRRVIVLRRPRMGDMLLTGKDDDQGAVRLHGERRADPARRRAGHLNPV